MLAFASSRIFASAVKRIVVHSDIVYDRGDRLDNREQLDAVERSLSYAVTRCKNRLKKKDLGRR